MRYEFRVDAKVMHGEGVQAPYMMAGFAQVECERYNAAGWELVSVTQHGNVFTFFLRRPSEGPYLHAGRPGPMALGQDGDGNVVPITTLRRTAQPVAVVH